MASIIFDSYIQIDNNTEITIVPYRSISYYVSLRARPNFGQGKRIKIITQDGAAHSLAENIMESFESHYMAWLSTNTGV